MLKSTVLSGDSKNSSEIPTPGSPYGYSLEDSQDDNPQEQSSAVDDLVEYETYTSRIVAELRALREAIAEKKRIIEENQVTIQTLTETISDKDEEIKQHVLKIQSQESKSRKDELTIQKLEADLNDEQDETKRLYSELEQSRKQIEVLRSEKNKTQEVQSIQHKPITLTLNYQYKKPSRTKQPLIKSKPYPANSSQEEIDSDSDNDGTDNHYKHQHIKPDPIVDDIIDSDSEYKSRKQCRKYT
jgi:chromosome segregation ATPase